MKADTTVCDVNSFRDQNASRLATATVLGVVVDGSEVDPREHTRQNLAALRLGRRRLTERQFMLAVSIAAN